MRRSSLYLASWRLVIASSLVSQVEDRALLCPGGTDRQDRESAQGLAAGRETLTRAVKPASARVLGGNPRGVKRRDSVDAEAAERGGERRGGRAVRGEHRLRRCDRLLAVG